jgi:hypothetical protein
MMVRHADHDARTFRATVPTRGNAHACCRHPALTAGRIQANNTYRSVGNAISG